MKLEESVLKPSQLFCPTILHKEGSLRKSPSIIIYVGMFNLMIGSLSLPRTLIPFHHL